MPTMTTYERALQIYQVLIAAAHHWQTLTYELLAERVGVPQHGLAPHLEHLLNYCVRHNLPPLTVLVGRKKIGRPSHGFHGVDDIDAAREQVYEHDWHGMKPVPVEAFRRDA